MATIKPIGYQDSRDLGFNRVARVTFADFAATASTAGTLNLTTGIPAYSDLRNFSHKIITQFNGGSAANTNLIVGVTGTTNAFITSTDLNANGTPVLCARGAGTSNGGLMPVASTNVVLTLTNNAGNLSTLTAGEVEIRWIEIPAFELDRVNN